MNETGAAGRAYVESLDHTKIKRQYSVDQISMKALGKVYRISPTTVKNILLSMGVVLRSKKQADTIRGQRERSGQYVECCNCGRSYYMFQGYLDQGRGKFCSQKCHIEYVNNDVDRKCVYCQKSFQIYAHILRRTPANFCSHDCYHAWQKEQSIVELKCDQCGKDFTKPRGRYNQVKGDKHFCSLRCSQDYRSRENHHNWKGGITPLAELIRGHSKNRRWVKAVFERDNYTCQKCGEYGVDIHCHHQRHFSVILAEFLAKHNKLDPDNDAQALLRRAVRHKPFFDIDNGITLCTRCHDEEHVENI